MPQLQVVVSIKTKSECLIQTPMRVAIQFNYNDWRCDKSYDCISDCTANLKIPIGVIISTACRRIG